MSEQLRLRLTRYGMALLVMLVATLVRFWLDSVLEEGGFALFFAAVVTAAWYGGLGPSLLALVLSLAISIVFFQSPPETAPEPMARVIVGLSVFLFVGITTALLSESMRAAKRRAEAEASQAVAQREQLRTTLACIGDAVMVADRDGRLTMMNGVAESLTGWTAEEAMGLSLDDVYRLRHETSGRPLDSPIAEMKRDKALVRVIEQAKLVARDGSETTIDESAATIRDVAGNLSGIVVIFRDATGRQRLADEQREAHRRKDEFLATLGHELRNPLAPVLSAVQLLNLRQAPDEQVRWCYEVIERQVQHLRRLIDDLLDISRITQDKLQLRREVVELNSVVRAAEEMCRPAIRERSHRLSVALTPSPVYVDGDPVRLAQVLMNLLDNAAKYTEPGGQIELHALQQGNEAVVRVTDTGCGISPEHLPSLFEMFYQVEHLSDRANGGLGIGLSLVRRLTEMHGGTVTAASRGIGQGCQFEVKLPLAEARSGDTEALAPQQDRDSSSKRRVLVVDDNRDAADSLTMLLGMLGHEAQAAYDATQAIELAAKIVPEIVILDLGMPEVDGYDAARMIRTKTWGKDLYLIALTGWSQEEDRRRAKEAGFDQHLAKPVEIDSLEAILKDDVPRFRSNGNVATNSIAT